MVMCVDMSEGFIVLKPCSHFKLENFLLYVVK